MTQYLLSIHQPAGQPEPEVLEPIMRNMAALTEEMRAADAWVFAGGLHAPETATVVRVKNGQALMTDGPFVEGREHLGGFIVISAHDLDGALVWTRKLANILTPLAIEVRPFAHCASR